MESPKNRGPFIPMSMRLIYSRADARQNRDRVLAAAREVLAEQGLGAEINEIAARAGVGTGMIYADFGDKEALVLEVAREMANKTNRELLDVVANVEDPREGVACAMQIGFERVSEYGKLALELVAGNVPPPYSAVVNHEALGIVFAIIIRRGVERGVFRKDIDIEYAVAVWFALVAPRALTELMATRSVDEISRLTTDFFLAGLIDVSHPASSSDLQRGLPRIA